MTDKIRPFICHFCRHYDLDATLDGMFRCKAFPKAMPMIIRSGEFDHRYPYPGDNGIRFERFTREEDMPNRLGVSTLQEYNEAVDEHILYLEKLRGWGIVQPPLEEDNTDLNSQSSGESK